MKSKTSTMSDSQFLSRTIDFAGDLQERIFTLEAALEEIKLRAKEGRDWNQGHFCDSRSQCQSIVALCDNALRAKES